MSLDYRPASTYHRVVVRETEDIPGDTPPPSGLPAELFARTVFLDVVPL